MISTQFPEQMEPVWFILAASEVFLYSLLLKELSPRPKKRWQQSLLYVAVGSLVVIWKMQPLVYWFSLNYVVQVFLFFLMGYLGCRGTIRDTLYVACLYVVAEDICRTDMLLFMDWAAGKLAEVNLTAALAVYIALCLAAEGAMCAVYRRWILRQKRYPYSVRQMLLQLLPMVPYTYLRQMQYRLAGTEMGQQDIQQLVVILGICTLVSVFGNEYNRIEKEREEERIRMDALLKEQQQRYGYKKEMMEAVRRQYHDMKKYLVVLENLSDSQSVKECIGAMRKDIQPFEVMEMTGNEVADIVLSDKWETCRQKQIRLEPQLSLRGLDHINPLDMAAILGNALDNAVEAVENLPEEKRRICIKGGPNHQFYTILVRNPYEGALLFRDGVLPATKKRQGRHGYGLKNIQRTVEKYEGVLSVETEDGEFVLTILLPADPHSHSASDCIP